MLEVSDLTKRYGRSAALRGVSFQLENGFCLVAGANGAGKTTLLRVLAGASHASAGSASLDGINLFADPFLSHRLTSYLSDRVPLYDDLSTEDHLIYRGRLKGLSGMRLRARVRRVVEDFDLGAFRLERISRLSAGQRRRVGLADALLLDARLLLVDEPFAGLDESHARRVAELLADAGRHAVVLAATHAISTAEGLDGTCLVLSSGRLAARIPFSAETPRGALPGQVAGAVERAALEEEAAR